jgi:HEAT repeat protein
MSEPIPVSADVGFRIRRLMRPTHAVVDWKAEFQSLPVDEALPVLVEILSSPAEDEHARSVAASFLGGLDDPRAVPALARAVRQDPAALVRARAVLALGALTSPTAEAAAAVVAALDDAADFVRESAARAAARIGGADAVPALERMRDADPAENNRGEAVRAIAVLRGDAPLPEG